MFYQTTAETQNTDKSTTGRKCNDGHAEVTRQRRAELFINVAPGGTVCRQYITTAHLLPEVHRLSVGNNLCCFWHHFYIIHKLGTSVILENYSHEVIILFPV